MLTLIHGHSGKIDGIKSGRIHYTLFEQEFCFLYLAEFSDSVVDIREQFPLFPILSHLRKKAECPALQVYLGS